jgi:DNA repair protein RadC
MYKNINSLFSVSEIEIVYRSKINPADRYPIRNSSQAYDVLIQAWDMNKIDLVEESMMLLLDRSQYCIGISKLSMGGISGCLIDPKIVFATALKSRATSFLLAHNHPSGNLKPSSADLALTEKLAQGGRILDMPLRDHLIVTRQAYCSLADEGLMP